MPGLLQQFGPNFAGFSSFEELPGLPALGVGLGDQKPKPALDCKCFRYQKETLDDVNHLQQNVNFIRKLFEPSDITQEMLDGAKDVIVKKRDMKEEEAAAIDTGESFWYAKLSEEIAKKAKSGLKVKIKRGEEEMEACLKSYPDDLDAQNNLRKKSKAIWELCPPPGKKKVPDEDPLPCGGTEKLRDEKFKWKSGDVMEFLGSCRSSLAMRHPKMKTYEEDDDERFQLAVRDMTKEYRKKLAKEKAQALKAVAEAEKVAKSQEDK